MLVSNRKTSFCQTKNTPTFFSDPMAIQKTEKSEN
jgi:hypothetical protein